MNDHDQWLVEADYETPPPLDGHTVDCDLWGPGDDIECTCNPDGEPL